VVTDTNTAKHWFMLTGLNLDQSQISGATANIANQ
jgi:hypothetical protein